MWGEFCDAAQKKQPAEKEQQTEPQTEQQREKNHNKSFGVSVFFSLSNKFHLKNKTFTSKSNSPGTRCAIQEKKGTQYGQH